MEWVILLPAFVIVIWLRQAGWSWTAILLLYDCLVFSFFWLIYRYECRTEGRNVSRMAGLVYAVLTVLGCAGNILLCSYGTDEILVFWTAVILPVFAGCLWFLVMILKENV